MVDRSVFISHSSKDRTIANEICERLEHNGIKCWIAPRDIPAGHDYTEEIIVGIEECAVCLLVFSSHSNDSLAVAREIHAASEAGKLVIPLRIENVAPSKTLAYYTGRNQWIDAYASPIADRIPYLIEVAETAAANQPPPIAPPQRLTVGAKFELLLERAFRHKYLAGVGGAALLALITAAGLWMQFGTRDAVQQASSEISSAASRTELASEALGNSARTVSEAGKQIGAVGGKLDSIDAGVRGVKKETSADPRKEVANLGARWDQAAFEDAVMRDDVKLVDLYLAGGMRVSVLFVLNTMTRDGPDISANMADRIANSARAADRSACDKLNADFINKRLTRPNIRRAALSVCDAKTVRAALSAQMQALERRILDHDTIVANAMLTRSKCKSELAAAYRNKVGNSDLMGAIKLADEIFEKHYLTPTFGRGTTSYQRSKDFADFNSAVFTYATPINRRHSDTIAYAVGLTCAKKVPTPERPLASALEPYRSALLLLSNPIQ